MEIFYELHCKVCCPLLVFVSFPSSYVSCQTVIPCCIFNHWNSAIDAALLRHIPCIVIPYSFAFWEENYLLTFQTARTYLKTVGTFNLEPFVSGKLQKLSKMASGFIRLSDGSSMDWTVSAISSTLTEDRNRKFMAYWSCLLEQKKQQTHYLSHCSGDHGQDQMKSWNVHGDACFKLKSFWDYLTSTVHLNPMRSLL